MEKPKTKPIHSAKELLVQFVQGLRQQGRHGVSFGASVVEEGSVEVSVAVRNKKHVFRVLPRLNPSRKLLALEAELAGTPSILLCPHISDPLAVDLQLAGIAHADLNGRLYFQTESFLLDREPKVNAYRNPSTDFNPFTLKSSRVVRTLLTHRDREWTQVELKERASVSRASVSLTLNDLISRDLVEQTRSGNRHQEALYRLANFDGLLDDWGEADYWKKRVTIQQYSLLASDPEEIAKSACDALGTDQLFFTQWFAAHLRHPYTTPPLVSAYVEGWPIDEINWGREVDEGGNLWLIIPRDDGVFLETQQVGEFTLVSDIQIYLDLQSVGQRGPEQARALREWDGFAR